MSDKYSDEFSEWLKKQNDQTEDNNFDQEDSKLTDKDINSQYANDQFSDSNYEETRKNNFNMKDGVKKIYVDKSYVDEQIAKSKPKASLMKSFSLLLVGAMLGSGLGPVISNKLIEKDQVPANQVNTHGVNISLDQDSSIENVVASKAIPSVVGIQTSYMRENPFLLGAASEAEGIGSGVIVSSDGYILTNAHVVGKNPTDISVLFSDKSREKAEVVYKDETLDLAVVKVNRTDLPAIEFADSSKVQIGDKAIAIGNPLGFNLQSTLTSGYISGLDRTITIQGGSTMSGLFQTDASINSGNSGGALLNSKGQLIGINTAKAGSTDGIGFAIPSNISKNIVSQIIEKGSFSPIILGIKGVDLEVFKQLQVNSEISADRGVYVADIVKDSSVEKAGLKVGDVILSIDDKDTDTMNGLKQVLLGYRVGDQANIKVLRDNKDLVLDITFQGESPNI